MNAAPGTYILVLQCNRDTRIRAGRLGSLEVVSGYYLYVGSAFGPGGLAARIKHHRKLSERPHWHVDYLRRACELVDVRSVTSEKREHAWAQQLANMESLRSPFAGFGSSDCGCYTHLFYSERKPGTKLWRELFRGMHAAILK